MKYLLLSLLLLSSCAAPMAKHHCFVLTDGYDAFLVCGYVDE